jgi:hypothetical protein
MKAFIAPSAIETSMPPVVTSTTVTVTIEFLRRSIDSVGSRRQLLDAERDAFLLDVDVQNLGLDGVALGVLR